MCHYGALAERQLQSTTLELEYRDSLKRKMALLIQYLSHTISYLTLLLKSTFQPIICSLHVSSCQTTFSTIESKSKTLQIKGFLLYTLHHLFDIIKHLMLSRLTAVIDSCSELSSYKVTVRPTFRNCAEHQTALNKTLRDTWHFHHS